MRAVFVRRFLTIAALALPAVATASPKSLVIWNNRVVGERPAGPAAPAALTSVSHTLYLNDCMPNGCTVSPGNDDSRTNRSSIPQSTTTLDAYKWGDASWNELVTCVKETFKPFDINIVTEDPGNVPHFESMIGGTSQQLHPQLNAGGVAPFIDCGATQDSVISFVFASSTSDINFLCGAVAQEAAHVWGLDHELDADDPMTYLDLGSLKRFQNSSPNCGEDTPRRCQCGGNTQNSFVYMQQQFGLSPTLGDASVAITKPREGQWVQPSFPISANYESELDVHDGRVSIDGNLVEQLDKSSILAWNAPADLTGGSHSVEVAVTDAGGRAAMASVNVNVMTSCANGEACADGTTCFQGLCTPGANEIGGLGATCSDNGECATNKCASDGADSLCTGSCESDGSCPAGFDCIADANLCWPSSSGGCSVSRGTRGGSTAVMIASVLFGFVLLRRRRA